MHNHSHIPIPTQELTICFVCGDYVQGGRMLLDHLTRHAGLKPDERVLNVGCGAGRGAVSLASCLASQ